LLETRHYIADYSCLRWKNDYYGRVAILLTAPEHSDVVLIVPIFPAVSALFGVLGSKWLCTVRTWCCASRRARQPTMECPRSTVPEFPTARCS